MRRHAYINLPQHLSSSTKLGSGRLVKRFNHSVSPFISFRASAINSAISFIPARSPQTKMHSTIVIAAFLASVASSSPVSVTRSEATLPFTGDIALPEEYNITAWVPGRVLKAHEVLLFGENRAEAVDQDVWTSLIEPQLNQLHAVDEAASIISTRDEHWDEKRECQVITSAVTDKTGNFVDWDVQKSPVVSPAKTARVIDLSARLNPHSPRFTVSDPVLRLPSPTTLLSAPVSTTPLSRTSSRVL